MENNNIKKFQITYGNKSDIGKVRQKNEDYMESFQCDFGDVFIVCDGMGGHIGGEIASRLAIMTIKEFITENLKGITNTRELLSEALVMANKVILSKIEENTDLTGMGTTCVILIMKSGKAYSGNIGDSRIYMIRKEKIYQITRDQSFVQELVDNNIITYEEAENHPRKNEITQALGISKKVSPQLSDSFTVYKNDYLILCSDGLSSMVTDDDIQRVTLAAAPMDACDKLVKLANMQGGKDNITVQIVKVIQGETLPDEIIDSPPPGALKKYFQEDIYKKLYDTKELPGHIPDIPPPKASTDSNKLIMLVVILLIVLSGAFAVYWFVLREPKQEEVDNKTSNVNTEVIETPETKGVKQSVQKFFDDLFIGENLDPNYKLPSGIKFEGLQFGITKDVSPLPTSLSDLKEQIRNDKLWSVGSEMKMLASSKNVFFEFTSGIQSGKQSYQNTSVPIKIICEKQGNEILIKGIVYYAQSAPKEDKEELKQDKQYVKPSTKENRGNNKQENNPIKRAEEEAKRTEKKVEDEVKKAEDNARGKK